jgi:hypothetical protein
MTRIRFDQLAKQYLEGFLEPLGTVQRNLEVPGESKFVDVWFTPTSVAIEPPPDLGLLSRIVLTPCLLEPFRNAPTRQDIRSCLLKLLWIQEDQRRKTEQSGATQFENDLSRLWILAATMTQPIIAKFGGQIRSDWLPGIYFLAEGLHTGIIAIDELPLVEETLWLRILGRDATQQQAIAEVVALPRDDPRRNRVLQLLVNWRITLEISDPIDTTEGDLMASLSQAYLEWEQRTREEGREEGIQLGEKSLVLRQLTRQIGEVPEGVRSQIDQLSLPQLEALGEALLGFSSLSDLEGWLAVQTQAS